MRHGTGFGIGTLALLLAACSSTPPPRAIASRPIAGGPVPVVPVAPSEPTRPTPAPVMASAQVIWALRGGLNVAALLCGHQGLRNDYNRMLKIHDRLLDEAYAAEQARYIRENGPAGQARHDTAMTRLYNGFASVPDRRRFCANAVRIAAEINALPSAAVPGMAARALTTLEPGAVGLLDRAG